MGKESIVWDAAPVKPAITPAAPSADIKSKVSWDQKVELPAGIQPTLNPIANQAILDITTPKGDPLLAAVQVDSDLRDDEKEWLENNRPYLDDKQFNQSREVMAGRIQGKDDLLGGSVKRYYFDKNGIPQPLASWEYSPNNERVASLWGSQSQANDDNAFTTFVKQIWNGFSSVVKAPAAIGDLIGGMITGNTEDSGFMKASKALADEISFYTKPDSQKDLVDSKAFTSASQFFNGDNWHPSTQNVMSLAGQTIGSLLQFLVGGKAVGATGTGLKAIVAEEGIVAAIPKFISKNSGAIGVGTTMVLSDAIEEADRAGLTGRDKYAVAFMNALGQGVLEMAIGGQEGKLLNHGVSSAVQKEISQSAVQAFKTAGGEITENSLKAAFNATVRTTASKLPAILKEMGKDSLSEAGEEITQQMWTNSLYKLHDMVSKDGKFGKEVFDADAMKEYFINGLGGALGGIGGGGMSLTTGKMDAQSKDIYAHLASGNELVLRNNLANLKENGQLDDKQYELANFRIDSYKRYAQEIKDVPLANPEKEEVFNLTWKDENVKQRIGELEANQQMTSALKEAQIKNLKQESKGYVDRIAEIISHHEQTKRTEQEAKKEEKQQQPDEKKTDTVSQVTPEDFSSFVQKITAAPVQKEDTELRSAFARLKDSGMSDEQILEKSVADIPEQEKPARLKIAKENIDLLSNEQVPVEKVDYFDQIEKAQTSKELDDVLDAADQVGEASADLINKIAIRRQKLGPVVEETGQQLAQPGQKETPLQRRKRIVSEFQSKEEGAEFGHHEENDTQLLAGAETIRGKNKEARSKLQPGSVLKLNRQLPEKGKKLHFPGRTNQEGYNYALTVHHNGEPVGTIKYETPDAKLINKLLDEGKDVQLVVTDNTAYKPRNSKEKVNKIEYQIVSKERTAEKPAAKKPAPAPQPKGNKYKEAWSKAIRDINKEEPKTYEEAVLRFFLNKNRISRDHFIRNTGFGGTDGRTGKKRGMKELNSMIGFWAKNGQKTDKLDEVDDLFTERFGLDQQEAERELYDILLQYPRKTAMLARVVEMQAENDLYGNNSPYLPEEYRTDLDQRVENLADTADLTGINSPQSAEQYATEHYAGFIESEAERIADFFAQASDQYEGVGENEETQRSATTEKNATFEDVEDTFYARPPSAIPQLESVIEEDSGFHIPEGANLREFVGQAQTLDQLDQLIDVADERKQVTPDLINEIIRRQQEISKLNYMDGPSAEKSLLKKSLVDAGKIELDENGNVVEVRQNSGYPSQLFKDLVDIVGDREKALNVYLGIKGNQFKEKFGDWENSIMKQYALAGLNYVVRKSEPGTRLTEHREDEFAWSESTDDTHFNIFFNDPKISRDIPFKKVKADYVKNVIDEEISKYESQENEQAVDMMQQYKQLFEQQINTHRDLRLHLIHNELYSIMHAGEQITPKDIRENYMRSVAEVNRLNSIELAKDYYGEPMIYMHAGKEGIEKFIGPGDEGYVKRDKFTGAGGFYFNRDIKMIHKYSGFDNGKPAAGKDIYYTFLKMKRPFYIMDPEAQRLHPLENSITLTKNDIQTLTDNGYDGIIWDRDEMPGKDARPKLEAVVFKSGQIDILGTFNSGLKEEYKSGAAEDISADPLATVDPEFFNGIVDHLSGKFPSVKVFSDPELFQDFLNKAYPGEKLDLSKIGAAIGNAVYIDPKRARQSTAIHEFAHVYWNMLPEGDAVKKTLTNFYGNEEEAVKAIAAVGTNAAKIKLSGDILSRFLSAVRDFFGKVRRMFTRTPFSEEQAAKDAARIMADRIWNNSDKIEAIQENTEGPIKYMDDTANEDQRRVATQLQGIAEFFSFDPDTHTYSLKEIGTTYQSVTQVLKKDPQYSYNGPDVGAKAAERGSKLHTIAEAIARGENAEQAADIARLDITPEALKSMKVQVQSIIDRLRGDGQLLPETIFASSAFKVAGTSDLPVVRADGRVDVYDFKTSEKSTNVSSYEKGYGKKRSKKDNHGAQLAMYAMLIESADPVFGNNGAEIGKLGVIPIKYTMNESGVITKVTVEPTVNLDYKEYRSEAARVLGEFRLLQEQADQYELEQAEMLPEDEFFEQSRVSLKELRRQLTEIRKKPIVNRKEKEDELRRSIRAAEDASASYKRDFAKVKDIVRGINWDTVSKDELVRMKNLIMQYDNMQHNLYIKRIDYEIGDRLKQMQENELGIGNQAEPDITKLDVLFKAPSDMTERNPALQRTIRSYFNHKFSEERFLNHINETVDKLALAVIKEKTKNADLLKKGKKLLTSRGTEKYFENLFVSKDPQRPQLKDPENPQQASTLSSAELTLLKHVRENMDRYKSKQQRSERGWWQGFFPQTNRNFWETYHNDGMLAANIEKLQEEAPAELDDMEIEFVDPVTKGTSKMTYRDAVEKIKKYSERKFISQAISTFKLKNAHKKAMAAFDRLGGANSDKEFSKYSISSTGEMITKFQRAQKSDKISYDVLRAYKAYMADMAHAEYMQPILPEITAVRSYYAQRKVNPNIEEFLKLWHEGDIMGKNFVGRFGRGWDNFFRTMQAWTYMNVMTFNVKAGIMNVVNGKFNQFRADGGKSLGLGEKRYWSNVKKSIAILKHYSVVSVGESESLQNNLGTLWSKASGALISAGEHWIQGAAFLGLMTDEEFANFDDKGNLIDKTKRISNLRLAEMRKRVRDVQGKYGFEDKRMYKHYAIMAAGMGFKGWMPDMLKERFGEEYTDMFGRKHKGSYLSIKYIFRDLQMMMTNFSNYRKSDDVDVINNKKNIREAVTIALMLAMYAMATGDDKESKKRGALVLNAVGDLAGVFNLSSWEFLATQPMPALGTIKNFIGAFHHLFSYYQRDGRYGQKGDWMFPGQIINVIPYNHTARPVLEAVMNPDFKG